MDNEEDQNDNREAESDIELSVGSEKRAELVAEEEDEGVSGGGGEDEKSEWDFVGFRVYMR